MNNSDKGSPSDELIHSLLEHYQNGRLNDAEKLAVRISHDFPEHQFAWTVLDQANVPNLCTYVYKMLFKEKNDYARDGQHPGPIANEEWANTLYEWIKETKFTV